MSPGASHHRAAEENTLVSNFTPCLSLSSAMTSLEAMYQTSPTSSRVIPLILNRLAHDRLILRGVQCFPVNELPLARQTNVMSEPQAPGRLQ